MDETLKKKTYHSQKKNILFLIPHILFYFLSLSFSWENQAFSQTKDRDKVDLKQIEEQFWSAKDTDFSVVQNRAFPKQDRFFLNLSGGRLVNDPFTTSQVRRIGLGYFFSERWGVEVGQENFKSSDNESTKIFKGHNGVYPNYNFLKGYQSISLTWVPFYAKMSFLDRKILYFDMQFNMGLGVKSYSGFLQNNANPSVEKTNAYHFDITQNIFFSKHVAFRVDLKNQWSRQNIYLSHNGDFKQKDPVNDTLLLMGFNFFY
jgi:outer membrane beta-barrel protein